MAEDRNIYLDVTPVPGSSNKSYNVFVFKEAFKKTLDAFKMINEKVSDLSKFKSVSGKLKELLNWNRGKPVNIPNYQLDNDKWYCELTIKEISVLRDMIYAHKNKFSGGTFMFESEEIERSSNIQSIINKIYYYLSGKYGIQQKLEASLESEKRMSDIAEHEKFLKMISDKLSEILGSANRITASFVDTWNGQVDEKDKVKYSDFEFKISNKLLEDAYAIKRLSLRLYSKINVMDCGEDVKQNLREAVNIWSRDVVAPTLTIAIQYNEVGKYLAKGYNITSVLGSGGFGVVVRFLDNKGRERALKIFFGRADDRQKEEDAIRRIREKLGSSPTDKSKKTAVKKYFNIPKVKEKGGEKLFVMKVANKALDADEFLKRGDKKSDLDINFFVDMARHVLKGLKQLHSKGIVHCDIKPDNIHFMQNNRFKIADVGASRDTSTASHATKQYYEHEGWSSYKGDKLQVPKIDVYALGCSMLEVLCGRRMKNHFNAVKSIDASDLAKQFTDASMNRDNISKLLGFIGALCNKDFGSIPTAEEALVLLKRTF